MNCHSNTYMVIISVLVLVTQDILVNGQATPSIEPSIEPSYDPTYRPIAYPTRSPSEPSIEPSVEPSYDPTYRPIAYPTRSPSEPTILPSTQPTRAPTDPLVVNPTAMPVVGATMPPSGMPSTTPTAEPTFTVVGNPTTAAPSAAITTLIRNTNNVIPSRNPTPQPTIDIPNNLQNYTYKNRTINSYNITIPPGGIPNPAANDAASILSKRFKFKNWLLFLSTLILAIFSTWERA